jgi:hypothetical protein
MVHGLRRVSRLAASAVTAAGSPTEETALLVLVPSDHAASYEVLVKGFVKVFVVGESFSEHLGPPRPLQTLGSSRDRVSCRQAGLPALHMLRSGSPAWPHRHGHDDRNPWAWGGREELTDRVRGTVGAKEPAVAISTAGSSDQGRDEVAIDLRAAGSVGNWTAGAISTSPRDNCSTLAARTHQERRTARTRCPGWGWLACDSVTRPTSRIGSGRLRLSASARRTRLAPRFFDGAGERPGG